MQRQGQTNVTSSIIKV